MRYSIALALFIMTIGCGGSRQLHTEAELRPWVGKWVGKGIRENRLDPVRVWTMSLQTKNNKLAGTMSDDIGEMKNSKMKNVKLLNGVLSFRVDFESMRGLIVSYEHRAQLKGNKLLSEFKGMEGGRTLVGKWEAKLVLEDEVAAE